MKPRFGNTNGVSLDRSPAPGERTPSALSLLLHPGIGIKRWSLIIVVGLLFVALGLGFLLPIKLSSSFLTIVRYATLVWLPLPVRGLIFLAPGIVMMILGARHLYRMMVEGVLGGRQTNLLLLDLHQYRTRLHGPKIVAIGGGTGLATLLRGLKTNTRHITAVVTVADDGGSSGRLRRDLDIPPPGDARNCLVALSDAEPLMERLMQYRFSNGNGLQGHNMGNLLLATLTDLEGGFGPGLDTAAQLLGVNGRVLPATLSSEVVLTGVTEHGHIVKGESRVGTAPARLNRVWLEPEGLVVNPEVVQAVSEADVVVIGPGSLYTSIIPNFLVSGLREALDSSRAHKVFVCNVATQPGETNGYGVAEHLSAFYEHAGVSVTHVIANSNVGELPAESGQVAIEPERPSDFKGRFIAADVVAESLRTRHDSAKLAEVIFDIAKRRRGGF